MHSVAMDRVRLIRALLLLLLSSHQIQPPWAPIEENEQLGMVSWLTLEAPRLATATKSCDRVDVHLIFS